MNYKSSVDRAKSYVNDFLKRSDKSSDVIVDEKIWQINKKYIAVQIKRRYFDYQSASSTL